MRVTLSPPTVLQTDRLSLWPSDELIWWLMPNGRGHGYATGVGRAVFVLPRGDA